MSELLTALVALGISVPTDGVYAVFPVGKTYRALRPNVAFPGLGLAPSPRGLLRIATLDPIAKNTTHVNNARTYDNLDQPVIVETMRATKGFWVAVNDGQAVQITADALHVRNEMRKAVHVGGVDQVLADHKLKAVPAPAWVYKKPSVRDIAPATGEKVVPTTAQEAIAKLKATLKAPASKSKPAAK